MSLTRSYLLVPAVALTFVVTAAQAVTIHVDVANCPGPRNGTVGDAGALDLVGHADHRGLDDRRVADQRGLDLHSSDRLPARLLSLSRRFPAGLWWPCSAELQVSLVRRSLTRKNGQSYPPKLLQCPGPLWYPRCLTLDGRIVGATAMVGTMTIGRQGLQ